MNKYLTIFLFFAVNLASSGQNYIDYYNLANEAEHQFVEGEKLNIAKETFVSLEKMYGGLLYKDNFYLGILYYIDNDSINGFKYLTKFVDLYGNLTGYLPECQTKFQQMKISKKAILELENLQNKIGLLLKDSTVFKTKYKQTIDSIAMYLTMDQSNRVGKTEIDVALDLKIQPSTLNYLKKYGLPNPVVVGDDYQTILYHIYNLNMQKQYLDFFHEQIIKGKECPFTYALISDKRLVPDETIFGSCIPKASKKTSEEQVVINRKKIGMSPYYNGANLFPRIFPSKH